MQKSEEGVAVSLIKGGDYEQVKIQSAANTVPDPRVAGPAIFFDSRLDQAQPAQTADPVLQAMGDTKKRAGSIAPQEPAYKQQDKKDAPSLRSGFRNDSEALYEPQGANFAQMSPEELAVHQTVERYNMVNRFLNQITSPSDKEFA